MFVNRIFGMMARHCLFTVRSVYALSAKTVYRLFLALFPDSLTIKFNYS